MPVTPGAARLGLRRITGYGGLAPSRPGPLQRLDDAQGTAGCKSDPLILGFDCRPGGCIPLLQGGHRDLAIGAAAAVLIEDIEKNKAAFSATLHNTVPVDWL
jgi:hypothetical protein